MGTRYHTWNGLHRPEARNGSLWAKIKVSAGPCSFLEALGRIHVLAFPVSRSCTLLVHGHLHFKASNAGDIVTLILLPSLSAFKDPCEDWAHLGNLG